LDVICSELIAAVGLKAPKDLIGLLSMGGLTQIAEVMLARASHRMEASAQNIANISTPGFKANSSYQRYVDLEDQDALAAPEEQHVDWSAGRIVRTGNDLDLAISGDGYFVVRSGAQIAYTRNGQFQRNAEGQLALPDGAVLQTDGGDATVGAGPVTVARDGTIRNGEHKVGQIAVVRFEDQGGLTPLGGGQYASTAAAARPMSAPEVVQGSLEQSITSDATEMLSLMASLRTAESGQHIVQLYDDLMAQAANSFGESRG
jgi:flagellar basal body rod protein FlgG